jgi:formiminotetrahydrofolate cyclodeaminase
MSNLGATPLAELLGQIAAKSPTPGGGAVACATGALAAALAGMVVSYSLGKKALTAHQPELEQAAHALENARAVFLELAEEDAAAYGLVNELMRLPEGDRRRQSELPGAMAASIQVPMAAIAASTDLLRLCERLAPITNTHLASDLGIAGELALAAARASLWNVRVNTRLSGVETRAFAQAESAVRDAGARAAALSAALGS